MMVRKNIFQIYLLLLGFSMLALPSAVSAFSVTYSGNGSTGGSVPVDTNSYTSGATVTVRGNTNGLVKTDSTFAGWNTAANGNGTAYAGGSIFSMPASNVTLYAKWITLDAGPTLNVFLDGSALWTPALFATAAWYDAADAGTITTTNGAVSQWADKSGYNRHMTQGTPALRPAISAAAINGTNGVDFTGDIMATAVNPFGATVQDALMLLVHKVDSIQNGTLFSLTGSSSVSNRWQAHAPWGDGSLSFDCGGSAKPYRLSGAFGVSAGTVVMSGFYGSLSENVQTVYKNGLRLYWDTSGHSVPTVGGMSIGGVGTSYQDTTIGEVIVINGTVSTSDRQKLEGYLAHKWGLAGSLPVSYSASHPYSGAPPSFAVKVVNLDGTVIDPEGDPVTVTWSLVSGPGGVSFGDIHAVDTTVSMTVAGTYVLRLTADDGTSQTFDDVTINMNYSVTYSGNGSTGGGVPVDANSYTNGATVTVFGNSGNLVKSGYTFNGWNTAADGSGDAYAGSSTFMPASSVTLYAQWTGSLWLMTLYDQANTTGTGYKISNTYTYSGARIPGGLDNKISSFTLEQGLMAVVAAQTNGLHPSKTYIASDGPLVVNLLPTELDNTISFIRISPWRNTLKKGICSKGDFEVVGSEPDWYYNWGNALERGQAVTNMEFVPMSWAYWDASAGSIDNYRLMDQVSTLLSFNEPDYSYAQSGQYGDLYIVSTAVVYHAELQKAGLRLGSPAPHEENAGGATDWLTLFLNETEAAGIRTDFVALHWYDWGSNPGVDTNPAPAAVLNRLKSYLSASYHLYRKPIWITEFNCNEREKAIVDAFLTIAMPYLDSVGYVERYAFYQTEASTGNFFDGNSNITTTGVIYRDHVSTPAYAREELPAPWLTSDVGAVAKTGAVIHANGTFTVCGSGAGITGSADEFRYVYQQVSGDITITAKIGSMIWRNNDTIVGVMIREDLTAGSKHAMMSLTSSLGAKFRSRSTTGGTTANAVQTGISAPYWVRLVRSGNALTGYHSSNGTTWTQSGTLNLTMSDAVYVGLAVSATSDGSFNDAIFTDVTVSAAPVTYTSTYSGNGSTGGSVPVDANSYTNGATVTVLGNTNGLVKTGSTFANWNTAANGSGSIYSAGNTFAINTNTTLYAQWTANTYTVTLDMQSGTGGSNSVVATYGLAMPSATAPTRTGYTFGGYYTSVAGGGTQYYTAGMTSARNWDGTGNTTLYAKWTINTYTVAYNGNGNTGGTAPTDASSPYTNGSTVTVLGNSGNLVKSGYTFNGWNTAANGSGTAFAGGSTFSMPASGVTLYAQWISVPTNTLTVNNGTGGGSYAESEVVPIAATIAANYHFVNWSGDTAAVTDTNSASTTVTMPAEAVTVTANTAINTYTVTFDPGSKGNRTGGGELVQGISHGSNAEAPLIAANTGWNFTGWNAAFTSITSNTTVTALYAANNPPTFTADPISKPAATQGVAYSDTLAGLATDADGDPLTFAKVSGPAWLSVAAGGALSGTPAGSDAGANSWTVRVLDDNGGTNTAVLSIEVNAVLPFSENFETLVLGNVNGQRGWIAKNAVVQSAIARDTQAANITSGDGYIDHAFTGVETNVWTDFEYQPVFMNGTPSSLDTNGTAIFYFNTNGHPVVYDGITAVEHGSVTVSSGAWTRVTVRSDYVSKKWDFFVNTVEVASGLNFYKSTAASYGGFRVQGAGTGQVPVDNVQLDRLSPLESLPQLTVISAYGSPNPAGVTVRASNSVVSAYIAGSPVVSGGTQYVATGWIGTGSAPASGSGTNTSFTITTDTTITWQWTTNYWINFGTTGN